MGWIWCQELGVRATLPLPLLCCATVLPPLSFVSRMNRAKVTRESAAAAAPLCNWDQSDISSGSKRAASSLCPCPFPPAPASIYLMPKTFNVIKTDNAKNAQNFKARAELKVARALRCHYPAPSLPPRAHLPHPPGTHTARYSYIHVP